MLNYSPRTVSVLMGIALVVSLFFLAFWYRIEMNRNCVGVKGYEAALKSSMLFPLYEEDLQVLDSLCKEAQGKVSVVVPMSVCSDCLDTFLHHLVEEGREEEFLFWVEKGGALLENNSEMILPGEIRLFDDISIYEPTRILLVRLSSNGWKNCYFRYEPGMESSIDLFLHI